MVTDHIQVISTSLVTAEVSDVILRETTTTRLVFRPIILKNPNNPSASVKGNFLFQRKSQTGVWTDFQTIPFSSLKAGEGYKLELKSEELLHLFDEIRSLYQIYRQGGVPRGENKFLRATPQLEQLAKLTAGHVASLLNGRDRTGVELLSKLINWAVNLDDPSPLIRKLVSLNPESLSKLNAAIGLQNLKRVLDTWHSNCENYNEEFWQKALTENSFVLEQVFSWPASIVKGKAYIGGKSVFNTGGNIVDFLLKNRLTQNAALIEIKTPATRLLGAEYRAGVFNTSIDLSGSVMQILNYRHSLQEDFRSITKSQGDLFDSFNPQCAVIIGNARAELTHQNKTKSFELFRSEFPGLSIVTFDELFDKTAQLISLLENPEPEFDQDDEIPL